MAVTGATTQPFREQAVSQPTIIQPSNPEESITKHGIHIRSTRILRGPNLYAYFPVMYAVVDIGPYEEQPSNEFPGFIDRLVAWLPGLEKHECSLKRPGGFIERLRRGTYLAHICEHVTLELQSMMGFSVWFGRARGIGERGVYGVAIQYVEEMPVRAAFDTALRLTLAAMHDEPSDLQGELEELMILADEYRLGPSTGAIVAAAKRRNIPILRVTPTGSLIQLGYGIHQKRILASETTYTSAIAVDVCQDKALTSDLLSRVGVPVPENRVVTTAEDAWQAALAIGLPVVVKPTDGSQGKGVSVRLTDQEAVVSAFELAQRFSRNVQVERYVEGHDFRLLVINGKLVAAAQRNPAQVEGDGQRTVAELIHAINQDPRRRPGHSSSLSRIVVDGAVELSLRQQGLTLESVPAAGQNVRLRTNSNLSTGGTAIDVTDDVHPSNVHLAELVAQILALDVAGIDMLAHDIQRPLAEQGGAIVEVNAAPGLRMHLNPSQGQSRDVGTPIVEMLYPGDSKARIPIIAITGTNGKTTVTRLVSHIFETARWRVGMTCTNGVYINKELVRSGDSSGPKSAHTVLLHPRVEVAVLETARGGIIREGLAFDECMVGVVLNVSSDHLGMGNVNSLDELARVKQVVVENVSRTGAAVLNAEDPLAAEMAAATDARVIYFSRTRHSHVMTAHLAEGGAGVFVEEGAIVLATGANHIELVELSRLAFTKEGRIGFQVSNALAATAAAWAADLNPAMIVRGLTTFETDEETVPGRFNVFTLNDVEVILDYGHNPAALRALGEGVLALEKRRTVMALALPGDRRDEDLFASTQATIPYVDAYVLYDEEDRRGRALGEIPALIHSQLPPDKSVDIVYGQCQGILRGWQQVQRGDRLIVICDDVAEAIAFVRSLATSVAGDLACNSPIALASGASMRADSPASVPLHAPQPTPAAMKMVAVASPGRNGH